MAFVAFAGLPTPTTHAPSIRKWSKKYLFSLGWIVLSAHPLAVAFMIANVVPSPYNNDGRVDWTARILYGVSLALEIMSFLIMPFKAGASKATWEGDEDEATVAGVKSIGKVNGYRLAFVEFPSWALALAAALVSLARAPP